MNIAVRKEFHIYIQADTSTEALDCQAIQEPFGFIFSSRGYRREFVLNLVLTTSEDIGFVAAEDVCQYQSLATIQNTFRWSKHTAHFVNEGVHRFKLSIQEGIFNFKKLSRIPGQIVLYENQNNQLVEIASTEPFFIVAKNNKQAEKDPHLWLNSEPATLKYNNTYGEPSLGIHDATEHSFDEQINYADSNDDSEMNATSEFYEPQYQIIAQQNAEVLGNFRALNFYRTSDRRVKINIEKIAEGEKDPRDVLYFIDGVSYEMDPEKYPQLRSKKYIGYIAQEVQKRIPEAVIEIDGVLHVDYTALIPFISEAVKKNYDDAQQLHSELDNVYDNQAQLHKELLVINQFIEDRTNRPKTFEFMKQLRLPAAMRKAVWIGLTAVLLLIGIISIAASVDVNQRQHIETNNGPSDIYLQCPSLCNYTSFTSIANMDINDVRQKFTGDWIFCNSFENILKTFPLSDDWRKYYSSSVVGLSLLPSEGAINTIFASFYIINDSHATENNCISLYRNSSDPKAIKVLKNDPKIIIAGRLNNLKPYAAWTGNSIVLSAQPLTSTNSLDSILLLVPKQNQVFCYPKFLPNKAC